MLFSLKSKVAIYWKRRTGIRSQKYYRIKGRHCTKEKELPGASCRLFLRIGWVGHKQWYRTHLRRWGRPWWRWLARWCPFLGCGWTWDHRWCLCSTGWCTGSQELQIVLMITISWAWWCGGRESEVSGSVKDCASSDDDDEGRVLRMGNNCKEQTQVRERIDGEVHFLES